MKLAAAAVVAALFAIPLFVGLGDSDFQNDEAIYAYAVDKILETGEWLTPVSIPHEDAPFLEKPPLKFWIVALPMALGVLPQNEFGMRFWDAFFGAASFFYVLAIGWKLGGPLAGVASVMMLFVHRPFLFDHGLRTHNMEAALVLSYCGGIYHFLAWRGSRLRALPERASVRQARPPVVPERASARQAGAPATPEGASARQAESGVGWLPRTRAQRHVFAIAVWFALGFMTKFVAALFLPLVLGFMVLIVPRDLRRIAREWKTWLSAALLTVALVAPWFAYEYTRFGPELWRVMFETHVVTRFTGYLDPMHLESGTYYLTEMVRHLGAAGILPVTLAGLLLLAWAAVRGKHEAAVILAWLVIPVTSISFLSSKLYHYTYPFVPPLALGAGYAVALAALAGGTIVRRLATAIATRGVGSAPVTQPVSRRWRAVSVAAVVAVVMALLPLRAYWHVLSLTTEGRHPLRSARECLSTVAERYPGPDGRGPGVWAEGRTFSHIFFYYLRGLGPYVERDSASDPTVFVHLYAPWHYRPVLLSVDRHAEFTRLVQARDEVLIQRAARKAGLEPSVLEEAVQRTPIGLLEFPGETLMMPGPFAHCVPLGHRRR